VRWVNYVLAVLGSSSILLALLVEHSIVVVVSDLEAEASGVNVPVAPEEKGTEDGLGEEVKDTIEYGFTVRGDDVSVCRELDEFCLLMEEK
jgi:hypothetical protein